MLLVRAKSSAISPVNAYDPPTQLLLAGMLAWASTGGVESATADLFRNGLFCLTPSVKAEPDAVKLATDLVAVLGARPLFLDPVEHDGLMAALELGAALSLLDRYVIFHNGEIVHEGRRDEVPGEERLRETIKRIRRDGRRAGGKEGG